MLSPNNAGMSPIDMESQEKIKLERKRLRNRLAASKCRKRKLERISQLDERVAQLKTENADRLSLTCRMVEDLEAQINGLEKSDGQIRERHLREIANWQRRIDDEKALNAQLEDLNQHTWDDRVREIAGSALAENSRPADALFRGSSGPSHVWETPRPLGPGSATRRFMP